MSKIKAYIFIVCIMLMSIVSLTGCLGGSNATGNDEDVVQLKFTYWGGPMEKESIENLIQDFNKTHPDIKVKGQQVQGNYLEKMNTMASSNTLPDVGYFPEGSLPPWLENGAVKDLTPLFDSGKIGEKLDYLIFQYEENGPIAGASVSSAIVNIYYNKDIFDEAGIPYPPTKAEDAWTWDEFVDVAKKLTVDRNGKHPGEQGFDPKNIETFGLNNFTWLHESFLNSNGGGHVSKDGKDILLDTPESIEALQAIADLMYVHHVMPKPSELSTIPSTDTALLSKRIAMSVDGSWALQVLGEAMVKDDLNLGIGVLPKFDTPVTTNFGVPIVVFETDHTNDYWQETSEFVKYIMDPQNSLPLIKDGLWLPNEVIWYEDQELLKQWIDNPKHPEEYNEAVVDWAQNNVHQNPNYYWADRAEASEIIGPALDQLWNGKKSAEEVVKDNIMPKLQQTFEGKYNN